MTKQFNRLAPLIMRALVRELAVHKYAAAAVVGNLAHETAGFTLMQEVKPVVAGSRGGYGWAQWTGPRRKQFEAWCAARGLKPSSYEGNLGFLLHELRGSERAALRMLEHSGADLHALTVAFEKLFERAGVPAHAARVRWAKRALALYERSGDANSKPLADSRTVKGAGAGGIGAIAMGGAAYQAGKDGIALATDVKDTVGEAAGLLSWLTWEAAAIGAGLLTIGGLAVVLYARWDDAGRPLFWRNEKDLADVEA
ncbi:MAG: phage tail-type lysozyme domain-containing protein [Proteobacteria bacterium]|nr:phage tail-type lysozyme domain-containing protein [Pseudomonadota bacterium]